MNKKALQLSVNFIVMLILAVVMFGFAITLTYNFWGKAEQMKTDIDAQTETEIERALIGTGARVALPLNSKTILPDGHAVFGLGILNVDVDSNLFFVEVEGAEKIDRDWLEFLYPQGGITVKNNERKKVGIAVKVKGGAPKDTYIANVCVCVDSVINCCDKLYGGALNKIYVRVP